MIKADEDLMMEYASGSQEALEEIFQRYKKRILNFALRLLGNLADSEDVVSEVFFIVTSKKSSYAPTAKFSTWIHTIAYRRSIDRIRARKKTVFSWFQKQDSDAMNELEFMDPGPLADEQASKKETEALVKDAVERLPLKYKEVVVLREYQQLSYEEIAKVLGCSKNKVKTLLFRARERLKKKLPSLLQEVR